MLVQEPQKIEVVVVFDGQEGMLYMLRRKGLPEVRLVEEVAALLAISHLPLERAVGEAEAGGVLDIERALLRGLTPV